MSRTFGNSTEYGRTRGFWRNPKRSWGKVRNRVARHRVNQELAQGVEELELRSKHTSRHRHSAKWDAY